MPAPAALELTLALPTGFRPEDILRFHRRDPEALSEDVTTTGLRKGLLWAGRPACLSLEFTPGVARARLLLDGPPGAEAEAAFKAMLRRMLGLTQDIEAFEATYAGHPVIGALVSRHRGLRVPVAVHPFEALVWAIIGQQISVHAAISIRRRLIKATGLPHSGGLYCHPDAPRLAEASLTTLRAAGLTAAKAATVKSVGVAVCEDRLPLERWTGELPATEASACLLAQRGIGPWTANYTLLRGYGWLDGSLHGDVAVRRSLQKLLGEAEKPDFARTEAWLAGFSPWRALLGAHLWAAEG